MVEPLRALAVGQLLGPTPSDQSREAAFALVGEVRADPRQLQVDSAVTHMIQ